MQPTLLTKQGIAARIHPPQRNVLCSHPVQAFLSLPESGTVNFLEPAPTWFDWNFRLFSASVRVSGWFWILPVLLGVACASFLGPSCYFVAIGCCFVSILLHEFGHVLAGRRFGTDSYIVLNGFGGV